MLNCSTLLPNIFVAVTAIMNSIIIPDAPLKNIQERRRFLLMFIQTTPKINKTELFINNAKLRHKDRYDYSQVEYTLSSNKVKIRCKIHGYFFQRASKHLRGEGCYKCGNISTKRKRTSTIEYIIQRSNKVHNFKYQYDYPHKEQRLNNSSKFIVTCPIHGIFTQSISDHLCGCGCPDCKSVTISKSRTMSFEQFQEKANLIFNNKYEYDSSKYINTQKKIEIICPDHGSFIKMPNKHLQGQGCPSCNLYQPFSLKERLWTKSFHNKNMKYNFSIDLIDGSAVNVDAIDVKNNIVYQFHGDYWHGNPEMYDLDKINATSKKYFGHHYIKTVKCDNLIKKSGYELNVMWEKEFDKSFKYNLKDIDFNWIMKKHYY